MDTAQRIWLALDWRNLCYYDPTSNKFVYKPWLQFAEAHFPWVKERYCSIRKIYLRGDTALWLGTTLGLFSYNTITEQFRYHGGDVQSDFIALHEDEASQKVYFTQQTRGVQVIDLRNHRYEKLSGEKKNAHSKIDLVHQGVLLPSVNGLWAINNNQVFPLPPNPHMPFSLPGAQVKSILTDNNNITWIGSNRGVTRFDPRLNRFSFTPVLPAADTEADNRVNHIYYSESDDMYFGISYHLQQVFTYSEREGYNVVMKLKPFEPFMNFTSFYADSKKRIWLLATGGIYQYDRKNRRFNFIANPSGKDNTLYTTLSEDDAGDLWLGTYPLGVFHFSAKSNQWSPITTTEEFESKIITALHFEKSTRQLWVGSFDYGLHRLDLNTGQWKSFGMEAHQPNRIASSLITEIARDSLGNVWVATNSGGLSKFKANTNTEDCINYTIESGLPDNNINALACDSKGNTWVATYRGLTCINKQGIIVKHFDNRNGLPFENYNSRLQISADGCIITALRNGFVRFNPDSINYATDPFPVVITNCSVKDSSLSRLDSLITASNRFPYTMNEWQFEFTALNFTTPSNIRYYYKLDGYDKDWMDAGTSHSARYTNLDNGHYTFRVKALHPSGTFSANEAVFSFSISPPFWKSWWFILLSVASMAGIVYFIYRYQLNKKLEVERLRIRISRDLHDDIGSALTSINVLSKVALSKGGANTEAATYLSQIKNAASETMESMSDIVWAINPENDTLDAMISRMKEFAAEICEAKQVELEFISPKEPEKISFDAAKRKNIYLIFKESVNNAIKYSQCTRLHIGFEKESNRLLMQVKDNGKGFDINNGRSGNGLKSMKERALVIGAEFKIESGSGKGTSVIAAIPLN